jgi:predicted SAM-dependent methyltransferase
MTKEFFSRTITNNVFQLFRLTKLFLPTGLVQIIQRKRAKDREYKNSLIQTRRFQDYISTHQVRKLQLGCGNNPLPEWLNTDMYMTDKVVCLDVSKPFPIPSQSFDYIYSEHLIEHLDFHVGQEMLAECFRILRPGGKIRLATPDLESILGLFCEPKSDVQEKYIHWSVDTWMPGVGNYTDTMVINNFFYNWAHRFIYDDKTLCQSLKSTGFTEIKKYSIGESEDENFRNIENHQRVFTMEFNKLETFILEACKVL